MIMSETTFYNARTGDAVTTRLDLTYVCSPMVLLDAGSAACL